MKTRFLIGYLLLGFGVVFGQNTRIHAPDQLGLKSLAPVGYGANVGLRFNPFSGVFGETVYAGRFEALQLNGDVVIGDGGIGAKLNQVFPATGNAFVGTSILPFGAGYFERTGMRFITPLSGENVLFDTEALSVRILLPFDYLSVIGRQYLRFSAGWFSYLDADSLDVRKISQNGSPLNLDADFSNIESDSIKVDTLEVTYHLEASGAYAHFDSVKVRALDVGVGTVKITDAKVDADTVSFEALTQGAGGKTAALQTATVENLTVNSTFSVIPTLSANSVIIDGQNRDGFFDRISVGNQVLGDGIADDAITNSKINTDAVTSDKIQPATIVLGDLSAGLQTWIVANAGTGGTINNFADEVTLTENASSELELKIGNTVNGVRWEHINNAAKATFQMLGFGGETLYNLEFYGCHPDSSADWNSLKIAEICSIARSKDEGVLFVPRTYEIRNRINIDWDRSGVIGLAPQISGFLRADSFNGNWHKDWPATDPFGLGAQLNVWQADGSILMNFRLDSQHRISPGEHGNMNPITVTQSRSVHYQNVHIENINGHTYGNWWQYCDDVTIKDSWYHGDYDNSEGGTADAQELLEIVVGRDITIDNCRFERAAGQGVFIYNAPFVAQSPTDNRFGVNGIHNIKVKNCYFDSLKKGVYLLQGATATDFTYKNVTLHDNDFWRIHGDAVYVITQNAATVTDTMRTIFITENDFHHNDRSGFFHTVDSLFVEGNKVWGDSSGASWTDAPFVNTLLVNAFFRENEIYSPKEAGMTFSTGMQYIEATGNKIYNPGSVGIYNQGVYPRLIKDNLVVNPNRNNNTGNSEGSGIYLFPNSENAFIVDNFVLSLGDTAMMTKAFYFQAFQGDSIYVRDNHTNAWTSSQDFLYSQDETRTPSPVFTSITPTSGATQVRIFCRLYSQDANKIQIGNTRAWLDPYVLSFHNDGLTVGFANGKTADGTQRVWVRQFP